MNKTTRTISYEVLAYRSGHRQAGRNTVHGEKKERRTQNYRGSEW